MSKYGFDAKARVRDFIEYEPSQNDYRLPIELLEEIFVYDVRHNKDIPIENYLEIFEQIVEDWLDSSETGKQLVFTPIHEMQHLEGKYLIVVQDGDAKAYAPKAALANTQYKDPYPEIYQRHPDTPKHFFNVNPNDPEKTNEASYLQYDLISRDDIEMKLIVTIKQLFLKHLVIRRLNLIENNLPCDCVDHMFIRKATNQGRSYEVTLHIDQHGNLTFIDHDGKQAYKQRAQLCANYGIDWDEMYETLLKKYKPNRRDDEELTSYDLIVAPGVIIDIQALDESVLYEYDEILERFYQRKERVPVDELKLSDHYPDEPMFEEFDAMLESEKQFRPELSPEDLTQGELKEKLAKVLGVKPDKESKISNKTFNSRLYRIYQRVGLFRSLNDKELMLFEGIWYTQDNHYMVGAAQSFNQSQPNAHLIRRVDFLVKQDRNYTILPLLEAMGVKFVRHEQYTVLPYYFHLIDLYVENVLKYASEPSN